MNQLVTYGELATILNDLNRQQNSPVFNIFNREKINRFYKQNQLRIQSLNDKLGELDQLVKKDENGKAVFAVLESGKREVEFVSDEAKETYNREYTEFMNR